MSEVCTCLNPEPRPAGTAGDDKVCNVCGHWWMPQHGSRQPALPGQRNVKIPQVRSHAPKIRRNEPCPCGSGKKFKRCCFKP